VPANVRAFGDDPGVEHRIDDRPVAEQLARCKLAARVEDRQARRGPRSARRSVDLAVGEDRHVSLFAGTHVFPEDHAVDAIEIALVGVDDTDRPLDGGPELPLEPHEVRQVAGLEVETEPKRRHVDAPVERPAKGDVERDLTPRHANDDVACQRE
jgi:hypothetical protein